MRLRFVQAPLVIVALALVLAACSPASPAATSAPATTKPTAAGATPTGTGSGQASSGQTSSGQTSSGQASGEAVKLRLLITTTEPSQSAIRALVDRFQKANPSIAVQIDAVPFQEYYRQVSVNLASGDPADIFWPDPTFVRSYVANGALLPLCCGTGDDVLTQDDLKDFEPSLLNSVTVDGKVYMGLVPDSGSLLFYNKELFAQVGITPPSTLETAWTWPQAIEAMQKVQREENGQVTVWGGTFRTNPPGQFEGMLFPRSMGEKGSPTFKGISDDGLTVTGYMDTPEAIQGFQVFQDLFVKYKLFPTTTIPDCFETGRCATKVGPADQAAVLIKQFPDLKWGVTPFPYLKTPIVHNGSQSFVVAAKTAHPKEAKTFVRFAVSKEQSLIYLQDNYRPPARKSLAGQYPASQEPVLKLAIETLNEWGQARPATPGFSEYNTVTAKLFADLATGAPVEARVKQAAREVDAQLAKYKK